MLTLRIAEKFVIKFEDITGYSLTDFSSYREIAEKNKEDDPEFLMEALDMAIEGEFVSYFDQKLPLDRKRKPSYVKDLAQLWVKVRRAMI